MARYSKLCHEANTVGRNVGECDVKRIICAISCVLLFVSFSVVFASAANIAHAQSSQSVVPTIALVSDPCPSRPSDPTCLIGVTTSLVFEISFSSPIIRGTFEVGDVTLTGIDSWGVLTDEYGTFKYHLYSGTDSTITLQIPADVASDASGNTNSATEITIRTDLHAPKIKIPDEYLTGDGTYRQYAIIKQPYVEPDITCTDEVYEDDVLLRTESYDAVTDDVIITDIEPEDLPRIVLVTYVCLDEAGLINREYLNVHLVETLPPPDTPPTVTSIRRYA